MAYAPPQQQQPNLAYGAGAVLSEKLEMFISCRCLPKLDIGSPSDPFVVIYVKDEKTGKFNQLMQTEVVQDNNNPEFTKQLIIEYKFEEVQLIRFDIYDADSPNTSNLQLHDYIGRCEFVLGDLVTANGSKLAMKIKNKKNQIVKNKSKAQSVCIIRSEEIQQSNDEFIVQFTAKDLPKMSWMSKTSPYLQLYRQANDGGWMSIMRTPTIRKTLTPKWKKMTIQIQRLCNNDYSRPILIKCFHDKDNSAPEYIGECETSLQELLDVQMKALLNKKKKNKKSGNIMFPYRDIIKKHGFLEYIMNGMEIQMIIAIDFTGSNGDPRDAKSLHYCGPPKYESPYMRAIRSVGRVIEPYDSDGQIACYGFGANINPFGNKNISHCFNLTLSNETEVPGIEGVLAAYTQCINKIQLYGPTYFNEIIQTAAVAAKSMPNSDQEQNYIILLIITDGIINDMNKTIDSVVASTELPLSIIIVGVGNADFSAMDKLDADDVPLKSSKGITMKRDIVQFVPFNQFSKQHISCLAKSVLEEVPDQITGYMSMKKLHPLRKKKGHLKSQPTMNNIYNGPSTLVRNATQMNVNVYPNLVQQQQQQPMQSMSTMNNIQHTQSLVSNQPVNPYYSAQQPHQLQHQQQPPPMYNNGNVPQQNPYYNSAPAYNPNVAPSNGPSAPPTY